MELDVAGARTEVPELVGVDAGALVLVNDDDLTYGKMRLDERSLATLVDRIGDIADPLPRALCWSAAWDMTRDAELPARDFVALVTAGLAAETEIGVVQRLLLQAQTALASYADPGWAVTEGWPTFVGAPAGAGARRPGLRPPAGDRQRARRVGAHGEAIDTIARAGARARSRSRASPWTPTCAGRCCTRWSRTARPATPRSRPSRPATRPPPGGG